MLGILLVSGGGGNARAALRPSSDCSEVLKSSVEERIAYANTQWRNLAPVDETALADEYVSICQLARSAGQPQSLGGIDDSVEECLAQSYGAHIPRCTGY